jgi:hypothetical protein
MFVSLHNVEFQVRQHPQTYYVTHVTQGGGVTVCYLYPSSFLGLLITIIITSEKLTGHFGEVCFDQHWGFNTTRRGSHRTRVPLPALHTMPQIL